ncbi:MAG TPA: hypothetical protein VFO05_02410 [Candidatus Limnocylindrales bacterium]|nr:hypothetical protein [Candidatus Limnocylindrales bacterium]
MPPIARVIVPEEPATTDVPAERAEAFLRDLSATWATLGSVGEQPRAVLVVSVYSDIVVRGEEFAESPDPEGRAAGFALALPERASLARPEGFEPPTY